MNIFVLDESPEQAARDHCDRHVVKMIVESAQMLSTAHRVLDGDEYTELSKNNRRIKRWRLPDDRSPRQLYKACFVNHPCSVWVRENIRNYQWLGTLAHYLCKEYTQRYNKVHKTQPLIEYLYTNPPRNIAMSDSTSPFALAMPDYLKCSDAVRSYRQYYINEKSSFATWKSVATPEWYPSSLTKKGLMTE